MDYRHRSDVSTLDEFLDSARYLHKKNSSGTFKISISTEQNIAKPLSAFILFHIVLFSSSDIHVLGTKMKKKRSRITKVMTMMKT